jgi:hypothetical protein
LVGGWIRQQCPTRGYGTTTPLIVECTIFYIIPYNGFDVILV